MNKAGGAARNKSKLMKNGPLNNSKSCKEMLLAGHFGVKFLVILFRDDLADKCGEF